MEINESESQKSFIKTLEKKIYGEEFMNKQVMGSSNGEKEKEKGKVKQSLFSKLN